MADGNQRDDGAAAAVRDLLGAEALRPDMGVFGELLSALSTAACLIDPHDRVHAWNAKHLEFLAEHNAIIRRGLPYTEILENYFRHNSTETEPERWRAIVAEGVRRHREMVEPSLFQKKDGRWLLSQIFRLPGGYALKIWTDKTRELTQTAVTEFSELSALSDCAIVSFDKNGAFRSANNRAGDVFPDAVKHFHAGCRFEVEMLECIRAHIDPAELDKIAVMFDRSWPVREALSRPVVLRRRDGGWLQVEERVMLDGSLSMIWIDTTKLLALEATNAAIDRLVQRLREAQAEAEAANRAKSQFLAMMSHELRTPMTGVIGMVDLLMRTPLDDDQRDYVGVLRSSADALLAVLNDILDFSKIEAGRLVVEEVPFDLAETIGDVVRLLAPRAAEKALTLDFDWPAGAPCWIHGDPVRVRQVLLNLLGNAVKFTERGGIEIRVEAWRVAGDRLALRVAVVDSGPGIDAATRGRLFQVFTQGDRSTTRKFGGTGLGLAICRRLIEAMGGEIGVDSEPGEGASFWFTITPRLAAPLAPAAPAEPTTATSRSARVLVADDVATNRRLIEALLSHIGHSFVIVENGREAVAAVAREPFDVVLMDMQMPEMDGIEATAAIRALGGAAGRTPIVALTADVAPEQRGRFEAAGIDRILLKPIRLSELQRALADALD